MMKKYQTIQEAVVSMRIKYGKNAILKRIKEMER